MVQSSALSAVIKETAALIEENMLSPNYTRQIDMSLIESLKQRRKEQLEREKSETRENLPLQIQQQVRTHDANNSQLKPVNHELENVTEEPSHQGTEYSQLE